MKMGGNANVVKNAVAPAIRIGSCLLMSANDILNICQNLASPPCFLLGTIFNALTPGIALNVVFPNKCPNC